MTLYRAWLQTVGEKNRRYLKNYNYNDFEFGGALIDDQEAALSIVCERDDAQAMQLLFQALLRHPAANADLLPYQEIPAAYDSVRRHFKVIYRPLPDLHTLLPNTTYAVEDVCVDYDRFGASHQISRDNNREIGLEQVDTMFRVFDADYFIDGDSGTWYPGIVTDSDAGPLFWSVPDELAPVIDNMMDRNTFPYTVQFALTENHQLATMIKSDL